MKDWSMTRFKRFKENKIIRIIINVYIIISLVFIVWMLYFDGSSYLIHRELNKEIDKLEDANEYYKTEIEKDRKVIDNLKDPDSLEKYAREKYKMKKENEDIYLIEYDTVE